MDLRNPQTQKWLLAGMAGVAVLYLWHTRIYSRNQEKIEGGYTRLEALKTELSSVETKFRTLDALKKEYAALTGRYQRVAQLLPEDDQLSPLLTKIHGAALETSSRVATIEPLPPSSEDFYERENFKLILHSTYHDLGDFLSRMCNLPFIVNVSNVELATVDPRENPDAAAGGYTLTATMTISTCHVKESERLVLLDQPAGGAAPKDGAPKE